MAREVRDDRATLVNVGDQAWWLDRTYGSYHIPAARNGQPAVVTIYGRVDVYDVGDGRKNEVYVPAREIAADLARELEDWGVFAAAGARPTEAELRAARERLEAHLRHLVAVADTDWARYRNPAFIPDTARRAARALHLEREWAAEPEQMIECPVCGARLRRGVALCRECRAVLDPERLRRFRFAEPAGEGGSRAD
jgi:hypothetical protein